MLPFEVNGYLVIIEYIVIRNEDIIVVVARDMVLPHDETMLATKTDIEVVNQSPFVSIRTTLSLVNMAKSLQAKRFELNAQVPDHHHQMENSRNGFCNERC